MGKENEEKLNCKFIFEENYNPKYINGAYGGVSPLGEIIIHFYMERPALPKQVSFKIDNGFVGEEIEEEREPKDHSYSFIRYMQNGIVMDYSVAKEVQEFLNQTIVNLEKRMGIHEDSDNIKE